MRRSKHNRISGNIIQPDEDQATIRQALYDTLKKTINESRWNAVVPHRLAASKESDKSQRVGGEWREG